MDSSTCVTSTVGGPFRRTAARSERSAILTRGPRGVRRTSCADLTFVRRAPAAQFHDKSVLVLHEARSCHLAEGLGPTNAQMILTREFDLEPVNRVQSEAVGGGHRIS